MRYFLLCLAAFMLLAIPVFAVDFDTVNVKVTIGDLSWYEFTAPDVEFDVTQAVVGTGGSLGNLEQDNAFTGNVKTNLQWTISAYMPAYTASWANLVISLRKNGVLPWVPVKTTAALTGTVMTGGPGENSLGMDIQLSGLTWTMIPADGPQTKVLTLTYVTN